MKKREHDGVRAEKGRNDKSLWLKAVAKHIETGKHYLVIGYRKEQGGKSSSLMVPASSKLYPDRVLTDLTDLGAKLADSKAQARAEVEAVLRLKPAKRYSITSRVGWHGSSYVTPTGTHGGNKTKLRWSKSTGRVRHEAGTLESWKSGLKPLCNQSRYLTFGIAIAFAAPLMKLLDAQEGLIVNFHGSSSTGKSTLCRAVQSVFDRSSQSDLAIARISDTRLEELSNGYNDGTVVIDDLSQIKGDKHERRRRVREFTYPLAGGRSAMRSEVVSDSLPDRTWLTMVVLNWEDAVDAGDRPLGEIVRLIDVAIPGPTEGGIFDKAKRGPNVLSEHGAACIELISRTISQNHGVAMPRYLDAITADLDATRSKAEEYLIEFENSICQDPSPWQRRLYRKIGYIYAGALLAADHEVAPWRHKTARTAVRTLARAIIDRVQAPGRLADDILTKIADLIDDGQVYPVVQEKDSMPKSLDRARILGIRRTHRTHGRIVAMTSEQLERVAGSPQLSRLFVESANEKGLLVRRDQKRTLQLEIRGYTEGKLRMYAFHEHLVRAYRQEDAVRLGQT